MFAKKVPFFVLIIALAECRPQVQNIEYQPNRPSFHPSPGNNVLGQIVPPGKPWPAGPEGYANFSQTPPPVDVANRWTGDNSTTPAPAQQNSVNANAPSTGSRPSFAWRPHDRLPQLVPSSGGLWPASPEGYANFSQTPPPVNVDDRWGGSSNSSSSSGNVDSSATTTEAAASMITSIGNRPFFASKPHDRLPQIVPAGASWPASAEGYANFSQIPNNRFQENGTTTTSRVLVNDLVNVVNLTHVPAEASSTTLHTTEASTTPRITTYRGSTASAVVTTVAGVTSTSVADEAEAVTSRVTDEETVSTSEAVGNRLEQVSTSSMATSDGSVVETTSEASHKTTTLGPVAASDTLSTSKAQPITTEASKGTSTTETLQAVTSHPSSVTEPYLGQLFTSPILEGQHSEQHVPAHQKPQVADPQLGVLMGNAGVTEEAAATKPITDVSQTISDKQDSNQAEQVVTVPQYPQIGLFVEPAAVTTQVSQENHATSVPNKKPTLEADANQANQNDKPCFFEILQVARPQPNEPSTVLVPPKPLPEARPEVPYQEVYAPSKFNDLATTTIREILTEIDRVTQQGPSRGQAGAPFTLPGFNFDFTKQPSYFGPTNSEFMPPSWFPGWIPGYNLVPSGQNQHHHQRYHSQHYYK